MERSALYRRALAPIMLVTGVWGTVATGIGIVLRIRSPQLFIAYWLAVSVVPLATALLLVRRQALKASEEFWSPPTRRVAQAVLPCLAAALVVTVAVWFVAGKSTDQAFANDLALKLLPLIWVVLYGCASHAAGFFMRRGIRLFGWLMIVGALLVYFGLLPVMPSSLAGHGMMGLFFGGLHLAYGVYLYFTEPRTNAT